MLIFVVGLPSRFVEGCEALVAGLVRRALGSAELTSGDTLEEVARNLLRSGMSHGVVAAHQPGGQLRRALVDAACPFIVAFDDPRTALADLVLRRSIGIARAIQIVASSCAASLCFRQTPGALVLQPGADSRDPLLLASVIARHLRLDLDAGDIAEVVRSLELPEAEAGAARWSDLDEAGRMIASGALDAYLDLSGEHGLGSTTWAPGLFLLGDQPTDRVTGSIDITGRVRCLLRGPQILLPPGNWSLSADFHVSPEAAEHRFLLEVTAGTMLSRTVIQPTGDGITQVNLTLALAELPDRPIELMLYNERPAFGGHLSFLGATLTRHPPMPATVNSAGSKEPQTTEL